MEMPIVHNETSSTTEPQKNKGGRPRGSSDLFPRFTRARDEMPAFVQGPYDLPILDAVERYRILARQQVERLLVPGAKRTRIGERLQKLYHHGYLVRRVVPLNPPVSMFVYLLDRKGAEAVARMRQCALKDVAWDSEDKTLGMLFLKHSILTNDVFIAIARSALACGYALDTWSDSRALKKAHKDDTVTVIGKRRNGEEWETTTHLYPDGYFLLRFSSGGKDARCHRFLEIDRGTEILGASVEAPSSWGMKVKRYLAYLEQGRFQTRYQAQGMVILTVTTSGQRLANLKRATERAGGKERFWFTTVEQVFAPGVNVLADRIWDRAGTEGQFSFTEDLEPS